MAETVYIETSVPSAYVSIRTDARSQSRRETTREWWHEQLPKFEAFASENVWVELRRGNWPGQQEALNLMTPIELLPVTDEIGPIVDRYIRKKVLPADIVGDAAHLAFASLYEVEYLVTWNIRHLANINKQRHLSTINRRLGLFTPEIVTPEWLWLEERS